MTETDWCAEPKIELHLHLEGAAPPSLTRAIAARAGVDVETWFDARGGYAWERFSGFLQAYDRVASLYATPEAWRALAEGVLSACAAHGVIHAELILSPDGAARGPHGLDLGRWREHLDAVTDGATAAQESCGITARFVPHCVRAFGPEAAMEAARTVVAAMSPMVTGFGMAGDERLFDAADFVPAFDIARAAGLKLTAHAGEFGGPDSVRGALDALRVDRIAHGVRAIEDPALVARLADLRTPLDICPGSNLALGLYPDWSAHPAPALRAAGCVITLSTDDPPFFHTDMTREYAEAAAAWGWRREEFRAITRDALAAAFCDDALKTRLAARLAR